MASINIDEITYQRIGDLAASKNRSVEAEAGDILRDALSPSDRAKSLRKIADELAALTKTGVAQTDAVDLLREDRER